MNLLDIYLDSLGKVPFRHESRVHTGQQETVHRISNCPQCVIFLVHLLYYFSYKFFLYAQTLLVTSGLDYTWLLSPHGQLFLRLN
jgi:hypothetical protein